MGEICKLSLWSASGKVKKPYLMATDDRNVAHAIAQLKVPPDEFWERLGNALNIRFIVKETECKSQ